MSAITFRGGPVLSLDEKGRLTVPAKYRAPLVEHFQGKLVVCKNPDGCLSLFPLPVWEQFEVVLLNLPSENDAWRRVYVGSATDVEIDSGSRILIPPELRAWSLLDKEVKFMGVGPNFELWDTVRYDAREVAAIAAGRPEVLRQNVVKAAEA